MSALVEISKLKDADGKEARSVGGGPTCDSVRKTFPGLNMSEIGQALAQSSRGNLVPSIADKACYPRIKKDLKVSDEWGKPGDNMKLFESMDNQLSAHNILAIGWDPDILYSSKIKDAKDQHASVVVGRRFNTHTNECEYLVRNSWGRGCSSYSDEYQCDAGNIWMPKDVLGKALFGVTYVQ